MGRFLVILSAVLLTGCSTTPIFTEFRAPSESCTQSDNPSPEQIVAVREGFAKLCADYHLTLNQPQLSSLSHLHYYRSYESRLFKDRSREQYLVAILTIEDGKVEAFVSAWMPDEGENQRFIHELDRIFTSVFGKRGYRVARRQEYVVFS